MTSPTMQRQHPGTGPTPGAARSAYPPRVAELVPQARALADRLGGVPSRNRLMSELRVGAPKASALRSALLDTGSEPAAAPRGPGPASLRTSAADPAVAGSAPTEHGPGPAPSPRPPVRDHQPEAPEPKPAGPGGKPAAPGDGPGLATTPGGPDSAPVTSRGLDRAPEQMPEPGPVPAPNPHSVPESASQPESVPGSGARVAVWPVLLLAAPAFVAIWSGWVGLGALTGFGIVHPLPGIWDSLTLNTAITLPIGVETYAAYALRAWLTPGVPAQARRFAKRSAIGALCLGALGQIAYHLMAAADVTTAPWQITALVSCLPVAVLGMGAALIHLLTDPAATGGENR